MSLHLSTFHVAVLFFGGGTLVAYGSSQAKGRMGATAACLPHSHSNIGSEQHL